MRIVNCGRGVHKREVKGVDRLRALPNDWYAFTNLDLATGIGRSREIDVIIVAEDRIFIADLKDWHGRIESSGGNWIHNGKDTESSPVQKVHRNAKDIFLLLEANLRRHRKGSPPPTPLVQGMILISGSANWSGLAATEIGSVQSVDHFIKTVSSVKSRVQTFGGVNPAIVRSPLTGDEWKNRLSGFFNARTGQLLPGRRRYSNFVATSDDATFKHTAGIFAEYDAEDENSARTLGTLRAWDFSKAEGRFQTEEGRAEIAGREQTVIGYLRDRGDTIDTALLLPRAYDHDKGIDYWEVFDRRRRLKRLSEFVSSERPHLARETRIELVRQMLAKVASLHAIDAAHLDLGGHSIWLEAPSTVRLSHLMAARYPQVASLGEDRYRFLSAVKVPEDVLGGRNDPRRKDVFLLGAAAHHLLFGRPPSGADPADEIVEWSPAVDPDFDLADLHPWFEHALSLEPANRYAGAAEALRAFNAATAAKPSVQEVAEGLDTFRTSVRTQKQLAAAYPESEPVREDDRMDAWKSDAGENGSFVKLWKQASWGDLTREAPRILDFLQRATDLALDPPPGCARIREALWLGDSFALVQQLVHGKDVAASLSDEPERWRDHTTALGFVKALAEAVVALHERGLTHGDLKPQNVIVSHNSTPVLVDLIDFSAAADGELVSTAYAPITGGRPERDRFAVGKIAEDIFTACDLDPSDRSTLATAITFCRDQAPGNATLEPLVVAIDAVTAPQAAADNPRITIAIKDAQTGDLLADEGRIYVRRALDGWSVHLRGACEEIRVRLNADGRPFAAQRRTIDQGRIAKSSPHEFMSLPATLSVDRADVTDLSGLAIVLEHPDYRASLDDVPRTMAPTEVQAAGDAEDDRADPSGDASEDRLAEQASAEPASAWVDVPRLWRALVDVEGDLTTEGVALGPSAWRRDIERHVVPFEPSRGTLDFNKADTIGVERLDRKARWKRIGKLDIARSRPSMVAIDVGDGLGQRGRELVQEDDRLRFTSHFGLQSLRRRENATTRILARQSRIPALIDLFDPRTTHSIGVSATKMADHRAEYDLNEAQATALATVLEMRPLGLVQGPPGTGKTMFIAALTHYALTQGLARNVLLASQSHEAVNNAAEAVLKLFAAADEQPSLLRVGNETIVSERLLPFHTDKVETLFKDRFGAEAEDRLRIAARSIGLPEGLADAVWTTEAVIRPIVANVVELATDPEPDAARVNGLTQTLQAQLARLGVGLDELDLSPENSALLDEVYVRLASMRWQGERIAPERIARLRAIAALGRDFMSSVSTAQRGFETFLAGTRQIVAGTCVGLGRPSLGLTAAAFDLVIVDEAARCTASELSVPMQAGRWVVLVGDQAQLEPQHDPEVIEMVARQTGTPRREILRSDFSRAFSTSYGRGVGRTLVTQYRMLPPIGEVVSATFYEGRLKNGRTEPEVDPAVLPLGLETALTWVSTDDVGDSAFQRREDGGTSLSNPTEADAIMAMLEAWGRHQPFIDWIEGQTKHAHVIGIICMYASQRDLIRKKVQRSALSDVLKTSLKIDTVDSYQGKENPIVVLSLVRNNADGPIEGGAATIAPGFLSRPNRINVAASRAMDRLVIVGSRGRWTEGGPMARLSASFKHQEREGQATTVFASSLSQRDEGRVRKRRVDAGAST